MLTRERAIEALETERFDVAVIGGGITGAGVALDAASRGYSVALVEKADFASGTSGRSSKLVHGGLRYLRRLDLGLVREALLERRLMVELAPHLVRPLPMVVPAFDGTRPGRMVGLGLNLYDVMATAPLRGRRDDRNGARTPARHRLIAGREVAQLLPALAPRSPTGGYLFYDCQTDDARLVLTVLGEAERFGAVCANRLEVTELVSEHGRVSGLVVHDSDAGRNFALRAGHVVNATGVWADRIPGARLGARQGVAVIAPSRGSHLTIAPADLPLRAGAVIPAGGGRSIFALPWLGRSLVGTTDSSYDGAIDHVPAPAQDIEYLLSAVNLFFGSALGPERVTGAFAGVRPLISSAPGGERKSVDISRRAACFEAANGLITITGGKLTTWRRMAKVAVDRLVERDRAHARCRTATIPLGCPTTGAELPEVPGVPAEAYQPLAARYGQAAVEVLKLAGEHPTLAEPIVTGLPDLLAEASFAARHEQARTVGDVLLRRTRLGLLAGRELCRPSAGGPRRVAEAVGAQAGWDERRVIAEVERFRLEADAEGISVAG